MSYFLELIRWFFQGDEEQAEVSAYNPADAARPEPAEKRKPFEFNVINEARPKSILDDLNSIEPLHKQFEGARQEILDELRRLDPRRRHNEQTRR